jgi:hypothetical protein
MKQHHLSHHLSNDELLDRMYLVESAPHLAVPHLNDCEECSSRLQGLERKRAEVGSAAAAAESGISNEFLAAQRRAIYARLDQPASVRARWAPAALAAVFLLVMGVFLVRPHPQYHQVRPPDPVVAVDSINEQLFSDLYSMEQSLEPQAAAPIHALFEVSGGDVEQ